MPYYIEDADLGIVAIHVNGRAKRIIARKKENQIHLTVPSYASEQDIRKALGQMKPRIDSLSSVPKVAIDENFRLETLSFDVLISRHTLSKIYVNLNEGRLNIVIPQQVDLYGETLQQQLRGIIETGLRYEAKRLLPARVKALALRHGFRYKEVKINKSTSRWGSCSSSGSINLSYFCMLLPEHLLQLVILHELCHTREMNHSDRFWAELDAVTDNKAAELTKELKQLVTSF